MKPGVSAVAILAMLCSTEITTGQARLVANLNTTPAEAISSSPRGFAASFERGAFFRAYTRALGGELWYVTPSAQVRLVADIRPGLLGSAPDNIAAFGPGALFSANDGSGTGLWIVDRPTATPRSITDAGGGLVVSPRGFAVQGPLVYFVAEQPATGSELWLTDGTPAGTRMVADVRQGPQGSSPRGLVPFSGGVAFVADDGRHGFEVWVSNGSTAGTRLVRDLIAGTGWGVAGGSKLGTLGSRLVFSGSDGTAGYEPWVTDGTAAGTAPLADIASGPASSFPDSFVQVGNRLIFTAAGASGRELYETDATAAGTGLFVDVEPGPIPSNPRSLTVSGDGRLFFVPDTRAVGTELWVSDGTRAGTMPIDFVPGRSGISPLRLSAAQGRVYCVASRAGLVVSDGTLAGTSVLQSNADSGTQLLTITDNRALFNLTDPATGDELWVSDGTAPGTRLLADIEPTVTDRGSIPRYLGHVGRRALFRAVPVSSPNLHLYASTGIAAGTVDLVGPYSQLRALATLDDWTLLATRIGSTHGFSRTDGTLAGTRQLSAVGSPTEVTGGGALDGTRVLFQAAAAGANDIELWISDGTDTGTRMVRDINPNGHSFPGNFERADGRLFFVADDGQNGRQVWVSDGTPARTQLVRAVQAPTRPGPFIFGAAGRRVLFVADDGIHGTELWSTDGTSAGTQLVVDLVSGAQGIQLRAWAATRHNVVIQALLPGQGYSVVATDGTPAGTLPLPLPTYGSTRMARVGDRAFVINSVPPFVQAELWTTDGTPPGTIRTPVSLPAASSSSHLAISDTRLAYIGSSSQLELVITDGSVANTTVIPLPNISGDPRVANGQLFLDIDDEIYGNEPHVVGLGAHAHRQGVGCGGLDLTAAEPRLGTTVDFAVRDGAAGAARTLLFGTAADVPLRLPFAEDCVSFIDPGAPILATPLAPSGTVSVPLPPAVGLVGRMVQAQAIALSAVRGLDFSNGQRLTFDL